MFSIVSMQDVMVNLKGSENLFKMFDRPRTRKKSTSSKTLIGTQDFPIKRVWVLPSHLITLVSIRGKEEISAYDQVPRLAASNKHNVFKLMENESTGVVDVFHTVSHRTEYLFILLKNGQVIAWTFRRPEYEWYKLQTEFWLFKSRDSQIISYVYDNETLLWCERRSTTQFCICKVSINFNEDADVTFEETRAVLHNCLPMNIYSLSHGHYTFIPVSNKTLGLFLFWSAKDGLITVRMWGDEFNNHHHIATTSDYQTIVRDCLYLWINRTNFESKILLQATHPTSKELVVLQNDLNVYSIYVSKYGVECSLLCTLEEPSEGKDNFAKQISKFYPLQRMLLLLMSDGTVNIYENQGGLFLWKTQTFRSGAPLIWIRKGNYPAAGVWNRSGIWNIRPKPIVEQLKEILAKQHQVLNEDVPDNKSMVDSGKVTDPDFALDVFDSEHKRVNNRSRKLRIKQGVSRSEDFPMRSLFNILHMWQLRNFSAETAISLATRLKELHENEDEVIDLSEIFYLVDVIKDPVLLLAVFGNKSFPYSIKKKLTERIRTLLQHSSTKKLDKRILTLLTQYVSTEDKIKAFFTDSKPNITTTKMVHQKKPINMTEELKSLESLLTSPQYHCRVLDKHLCLVMDLDANGFVEFVLNLMMTGDVGDENNERLTLEIWKTFVSDQCRLARRIISHLWQHNPGKIVILLKSLETFVEENREKLFPIVFKFEKFIRRLWNTFTLTEDENKSVNQEMRMQVFCQLVQKLPSEEAFDVYLQHDIVEQAFHLLQNKCSDSQSNEDPIQHTSMFFQMLAYLLGKKLLGCYATRLSTLLPDTFKMAEFWNMYQQQAGFEASSRCGIFVKHEKDLCVGDMKSLFEKLLED
ncbi:uncharacterized protein [Clytia hemisphaerica]|uniref:BLOC-2 complex member HPS6 N-terminal domain-containing protein n=1 Tax=Clytia hemisphaerica TaxID=252671 RepID=A0A7M5UBN5_9CNID